METRFWTGNGLPTVTTREDGEVTVTGTAAVYYDGTEATEFNLWDGAVERIMPGAFDRVVSEKDDVRGLFNHDPNQLLGRTSAGTMEVTADKGESKADASRARGLHYAIRLGDTGVARDVIQHIKRGDLRGSSFAFSVMNETWRKEDGVNIREIRGVRLFDVGPVTYPAYESTTTGLRSVGNDCEARQSFDAWQADGAKAVAEGKASVNKRWVDSVAKARV